MDQVTEKSIRVAIELVFKTEGVEGRTMSSVLNGIATLLARWGVDGDLHARREQVLR